MTGETVIRETERKYDVASELRSDALAHVTGYASQDAEELNLAAEYFDTQDLRLLKSGVTLRRRVGGHDPGWHLKIPDGRDSRTEIQLPLTEDGRPPRSCVDATAVHTLGAELVPVATISTRRSCWPLVDRGGHDVAELVDDLVCARPAGTSAAPQTWREVEVELSGGVDPSVLDVIETRLSSLGLRRARTASKLARVLERRIPPRARSKLGRHSDAADVVLEYVRIQTEVLRHYDPLARQDIPDAVHQMRVAARRLRAALQTFDDVLDPDRTRELVDDLRWIAGELAPARDLEVMTHRYAQIVSELEPETVVGSVDAEIDTALRLRAAQAHATVTAALTSPRYLKLHRRIHTMLKQPPTTRHAHRRAGPILAAGIRAASSRLQRRMTAVERAAAGPQRELALHDARKAVKRLRYACEVAAPVLGEPVLRLQKRLRKLATILGVHQDTVVARSMLRELGTHADEVGGHGFTYGVMHGIETARATEAERDLPGTWRGTRSAML